jgi:hypothetical protein
MTERTPTWSGRAVLTAMLLFPAWQGRADADETLMAREEKPVFIEFAGVRAGAAGDGWGRIRQVEIFAARQVLPVEIDLGRKWYLRDQLELAVGWMGDNVANGALMKAGLALVAGQEKGPVSFQIGFSPTYISEDKFETKDFGSHLQFTTHAGVNFHLNSKYSIGYLLEHMSNGGLSRPNPGLNVHLLSFTCRFR